MSLIESTQPTTGEMKTDIQLFFDAIKNGQVDLVESLICNGMDANQFGKCSFRDANWAPLHCAASGSSNVAILECLALHGANLNAKDDEGMTPLHWAMMNDNVEVAKYLIISGADVNARARYDDTPLHHAAIIGNVEVARLLIYYGADKDAKEMNGNTPLVLARRNWNDEMVEYLSKLRTSPLRRVLDKALHESIE